MQNIKVESSTRMKLIKVIIVAAVFASFAVGKIATPYMLIATISYFLMLAGFYYRRIRQLHMPLMFAAIILDLSLVLILEFQREAIKTAMAMSLSPLQQAHIGFSTLATLCYFPLLFWGYRIWKNQSTNQQLSLHKKVGKFAFVFRTIGFLLMFSLLTHVKK